MVHSGGMHVEVSGTRLWFDVDGPALVPDGSRLRERPTVILVHGGPGSYDHSYFKPHFERLTECLTHHQVVIDQQNAFQFCHLNCNESGEAA